MMCLHLRWSGAELLGEVCAAAYHLQRCSCRVRLVMLFALRYERDGREEINRLIKTCQDLGMDLRDFGVVRTLLLRAGADQ